MDSYTIKSNNVMRPALDFLKKICYNIYMFWINLKNILPVRFFYVQVKYFLVDL